MILAITGIGSFGPYLYGRGNVMLAIRRLFGSNIGVTPCVLRFYVEVSFLHGGPSPWATYSSSGAILYFGVITYGGGVTVATP